MTGPPAPARINGRARNLADASRLWTMSEELTGLHFPVLAKAA
ncbi:MAG: hypothetical protein ABL866_17460 [Devosia sp.]